MPMPANASVLCLVSVTGRGGGGETERCVRATDSTKQSHTISHTETETTHPRTEKAQKSACSRADDCEPRQQNTRHSRFSRAMARRWTLFSLSLTRAPPPGNCRTLPRAFQAHGPIEGACPAVRRCRVAGHRGGNGAWRGAPLLPPLGRLHGAAAMPCVSLTPEVRAASGWQDTSP